MTDVGIYAHLPSNSCWCPEHEKVQSPLLHVKFLLDHKKAERGDKELKQLDHGLVAGFTQVILSC